MLHQCLTQWGLGGNHLFILVNHYYQHHDYQRPSFSMRRHLLVYVAALVAAATAQAMDSTKAMPVGMYRNGRIMAADNASTGNTSAPMFTEPCLNDSSQVAHHVALAQHLCAIETTHPRTAVMCKLCVSRPECNCRHQ